MVSMHDVIDKAKWIAKDYLLDCDLPRRYARAAERSEVNPRKALFVNEKLETVPAAFSIIMPYVQFRYGIEPVFVGIGKDVVSRIEYFRRCQHFVENMADAAYVFLEDASDVVSCVDLRPDTKVVQLWHACGAFKKWGMSTADKHFGNTAEKLREHPFYGNLSLVSVSSPEVAWAYREAMMLEDTPEIVQACGVSRTDVYYDEGFAAASADWVRAAYPPIGNRKIILYAPTFRGTTRQAFAPDRLDIVQLKRALGEDYALVVRHHPFVKSPPPIPAGCEDFAFMSEPDDPIDALLVASDVLITDYSSVVFEYALLERPMLFFAYDLDDYNDWRGFYYDYDEMTPGPVVKDTDAVIRYVESLAEGFDQSEVHAFREKFMSACDGHSTQRICEAVMG